MRCPDCQKDFSVDGVLSHVRCPCCNSIIVSSAGVDQKAIDAQDSLPMIGHRSVYDTMRGVLREPTLKMPALLAMVAIFCGMASLIGPLYYYFHLWTDDVPADKAFYDSNILALKIAIPAMLISLRAYFQAAYADDYLSRVLALIGVVFSIAITGFGIFYVLQFGVS